MKNRKINIIRFSFVSIFLFLTGICPTLYSQANVPVYTLHELNEDFEVNAYGMGEMAGEVCRLEITNNSSEKAIFYQERYYIYDEKYQHLGTYEEDFYDLPPYTTTNIYLKGNCLRPEREEIPFNKKIKDPKRRLLPEKEAVRIPKEERIIPLGDRYQKMEEDDCRMAAFEGFPYSTDPDRYVREAAGILEKLVEVYNAIEESQENGTLNTFMGTDPEVEKEELAAIIISLMSTSFYRIQGGNGYSSMEMIKKHIRNILQQIANQIEGDINALPKDSKAEIVNQLTQLLEEVFELVEELDLVNECREELPELKILIEDEIENFKEPTPYFNPDYLNKQIPDCSCEDLFKGLTFPVLDSSDPITRPESGGCVCEDFELQKKTNPKYDNPTAPVDNPNAVYNPEPTNDEANSNNQNLDLNEQLIWEERAHWRRLKRMRAAEEERNEQFRQRALELADQSEGWTRERWLEIAENPGDWEIRTSNPDEISLSPRPWNAAHQKQVEESIAKEKEEKELLEYYFKMAGYANDYTRASLCFGRVNNVTDLKDWFNKFNIYTISYAIARNEYDNLARAHLPKLAYADSDDARTFMKWIADHAKEYRMGCCNEHAAIAGLFLDQSEIPCMVVGSWRNEHAFLVIGTTKGNVKDWKNVVICDPYYNKVFVADIESFKKHYPDYALKVNRIAIFN